MVVLFALNARFPGQGWAGELGGYICRFFSTFFVNIEFVNDSEELQKCKVSLHTAGFFTLFV